MNPKTDRKNGIKPNRDALAIAMERCDNLIEYYEDHQKRYRRRMAYSRLIAIFLSGLVPVLVIIQMSLKSNTAWWLVISVLIASFPAGATIISTMDEIFQYKENWIRTSETAEELKSEKQKFRTRTTKDYDRAMDDYKALSNFVSRIEAITLKETRKWRIQAEKSKGLDVFLKSVSREANKQ